jgi:hypothetical protein
MEECESCLVFVSYTLVFALKLREKHEKTLVTVRKTSVTVRKTSVRVIKTSVRYSIHVRVVYSINMAVYIKICS